MRTITSTRRTAQRAVLMGIITLSILAAAPLYAAGLSPAATSASAVELRTALRALWEDHVAYTRTYIISALAGLPDTQAVAERLFENQDQLGNAIKPFYGDQAGTALSGLLRAHIAIAAEIVAAAKAGDSAAVDAREKKWHQNGDQIASFLAGANPNWSKATLSDMLSKHLDYTTTEVVSRLKGDWKADMAAYDAGAQHMLMFSDMLAAGITAQFPARFAK